MGAGKVFAIIGGVLGVLSVVLYYIAPGILSLWRLDAPGMIRVYLGGFGAISGEVGINPFPIRYAEDIILMIVIVLIIGGSVLTFIAGLTERKVFGILGGIIFLAGPTLLLFEIITKIGVFETMAAVWLPGENLLFGSFPGIADWGLGIGSYLAIGGGILGIIGGATV
jgi:hypothetical protein